jgi:uncharacterized protein involved in high-affinity Fe2+ transport
MSMGFGSNMRARSNMGLGSNIGPGSKRVLGSKWLGSLAAIFFATLAFPSTAKEYPIGKPQFAHGMEIAAVYLQPIAMEPEGAMRPAVESDVHLEADIRAAKDNSNGFSEGDFIPYLEVAYELTKVGADSSVKGTFVPMVASDGPHYGDNVKLAGPGRYKLTLKVAPPKPHFGRHADKETGVSPWFAPFELDYDFVYAGTGKKGAY